MTMPTLSVLGINNGIDDSLMQSHERYYPAARAPYQPGQKTTYFTLLHPTLCIGDLSYKSSICSNLRKCRVGLKIPRCLVHWGSPPFGTNQFKQLGFGIRQTFGRLGAPS